MVNRHRRTPTAQVLGGGAGRSLPPLPIIDRASICPCPTGKADPALAHVPLVKALRYLARPCCLRSGMRMKVFGLCPTFHAVPPFSCLAEKRLADLHVPPSREPPLARGYPLSPASPGLPLSRLPNSAGRRCTRFPYLLCEQGAPVRASSVSYTHLTLPTTPYV